MVVKQTSLITLLSTTSHTVRLVRTMLICHKYDVIPTVSMSSVLLSLGQYGCGSLDSLCHSVRDSSVHATLFCSGHTAQLTTVSVHPDVRTYP